MEPQQLAVVVRRKTCSGIGNLCFYKQKEETTTVNGSSNDNKASTGSSTAPFLTTNVTQNMLKELKPPKSNFATTYDGKKMVAVYDVEGSSKASAVVYDTESGMETSRFGNYVTYVTFSPKGTFVQTWSRFQEKTLESPEPPGCVTIWKTADGERLASFDAKNFRSDNWPCIQWTSDESLAVRKTTNQIVIHGDLDQPPLQKITVNDLKIFGVSPLADPCYVATFVPPKSSKPARVEVYKRNESSPVLAKSMFKADSCQFLWNKKATALLCWTSSDSDSSGKSYYGESFLYYGCPNKSKELQLVELPRKGPIQDVAWSPDGEHFLIVYGSMPARATLFNWLCEPLFDFGTGTRNTISFSPHGRFLCLGGFGNLPGDLEFWDVKDKKLLGRASAPCTTSFMWSPDSQYFSAATTFPRLRVDNGFKIFRYQGTLIGNFPVDDELYQVEFLDRDASKYPDRSPSPSPSPRIIGTQNAHSKNANGSAQTTTSAQNNIYRPPALRGKQPSVRLHEEEAPRPLDAKTWLRETKQAQNNKDVVVKSKNKVVGLPSSDEEEEEKVPKSQGKNKKKKKAAQKKKKEMEEKGFELKEELPASVKQLMNRESFSKNVNEEKNNAMNKVVKKTANLSLE
jgi:translation initiation factor 2A